MDVALAIDLLIIIGYFVGIMAIGLYAGRKEDNLEDYALGGRKMPWWAVMASIIAAETSAATFLGSWALNAATMLFAAARCISASGGLCGGRGVVAEAGAVGVAETTAVAGEGGGGLGPGT